jgi:hypothetical protein
MRSGAKSCSGSWPKPYARTRRDPQHDDGFPCLRINGDFFACVERSTGNLIIKLPADRVNELIAYGAGIPFSPNGKVFREWMASPVPDEDEWAALLAEAQAFVDG